jgi:hypothetical protein
MPLQNRVTPFGEIIASPARGTLMGNRGIIHDPVSKRLLTRRWQHRVWICCVLEWKGFRHPIMGKGSYTELFFLDECTALAAGHRPCAYCRRADYNAFKRAWTAANVPGTLPVALPVAAIDRQLHGERVTRRREKRTFSTPLDALPDGTFIAIDGSAYLVLGESLLEWAIDGYRERRERGDLTFVEVLTPASTVAAMRDGYRPTFHPSALAHRA